MRILDRWVYPINRPLKAHEKQHQLDHKIPIQDVEPWDWLSLIKMNSTYMELVDKEYHDKAPVLIWIIFAFTLSLFLLLYGPFVFIEGFGFNSIYFFLIVLFVFVPLFVLVNYFRTLLICNFRSSLGSYNHSPYEAF